MLRRLSSLSKLHSKWWTYILTDLKTLLMNTKCLIHHGIITHERWRSSRLDSIMSEYAPVTGVTKCTSPIMMAKCSIHYRLITSIKYWINTTDIRNTLRCYIRKPNRIADNCWSHTVMLHIRWWILLCLEIRTDSSLAACWFAKSFHDCLSLEY